MGKIQYDFSLSHLKNRTIVQCPLDECEGIKDVESVEWRENNSTSNNFLVAELFCHKCCINYKVKLRNDGISLYHGGNKNESALLYRYRPTQMDYSNLKNICENIKWDFSMNCKEWARSVLSQIKEKY